MRIIYTQLVKHFILITSILYNYQQENRLNITTFQLRLLTKPDVLKSFCVLWVIFNNVVSGSIAMKSK